MNSINQRISIGALLILTFVLGYTVSVRAQETVTLTLVDEAGDPLANYPADYPSEMRNLKYKYRYNNGGSWAPWTSFQTNASGQFIVSIEYPNWDNKVTINLNQTSKEQDVTVNTIFQAAKVNVNLKNCTYLITEDPGGTVGQGGGYWYTHGTTGSSGTVTFYTFPGNIKLRMNYNHNTEEISSIAISTGTNEVDLQTTKLTINYADDVRSNKGGSWWMFIKPSMYLLPDSYDFYFWDGSAWSDPVTISVSGCEMVYPELLNQPPVAVCQDAVLPAGADGYAYASIDGGSYDPDEDSLAIEQDPPGPYSVGVYSVVLCVTDPSGDQDSCEAMFVVYDPSAGFVTGGGWIYSEPGYYRLDTSLEGKASFGFVAKYKKGASVPDGNTEFQFKAGDMNFHSYEYDWLVVSGSDKAKFKGTGTINGDGPYKFMIWAGDKAWDGVDSFRIKIWTEGNDDNPVYDNGEGDGPGTKISGGNIVIHTN